MFTSFKNIDGPEREYGTPFFLASFHTLHWHSDLGIRVQPPEPKIIISKAHNLPSLINIFMFSQSIVTLLKSFEFT